MSREFFQEFRRQSTGLLGLGFLILFILLTLSEKALLPFKEVNTRWRDISYWQDNPANAPPVWTNLFASKKAASTLRIDTPKTETRLEKEGKAVLTSTFLYSFTADRPPLDVIVYIPLKGKGIVSLTIVRPDGKQVPITQRFVHTSIEETLRFSLNSHGKETLFSFLKEHEKETNLGLLRVGSIQGTEILFNTAQVGMSTSFNPLKGEYQIILTTQGLSEEALEQGPSSLIITGSVSGLLGTDSMKRDIFSGLLAGLKWALFIGLFTSAVSVIIGVLYGIVSAYFGGLVDTFMQYIYQLFISIPLLPVLIVFSAVFKPSLWFLITLMVLFSWPGSVMTVRSMALQLKEETFIEAARALGAGHRWIILKHLAPLLIPYSFAVMALSVPSAIVYESSVSLLGLGDASIVTWGQILHEAMLGNALLNGLWWWVIPPGLSIAFTGMTFAFLGFAMDRILHPKLRSR